MARKDKTLADYAVIAISPALIMTLIASLVFFLLEVFYQGHYQGRLMYILGLFIMATVCIGRISIEESNEYAAIYALPLALAAGLAMFVLVKMEGLFAPIGWLINWGILALIWFCAHKLTWDCTVIDELEDASGEGLLQIVGLDSTDSKVDDKKTDNGNFDLEEPQGASSYEEKTPTDWWTKLLDRSNKPHAPGVWVVYFSLAALPMFGMGQWFISSDNVAGTRFAFRMLFIYVASSLGLLLTTSFLGLRRYLRQRRIDMPPTMASAWLGIGSVLILVLLLVAAILPKANPLSTIAQALPFQFTSPDDLKPSKYGIGNDGPLEEKLGTRTGPQSKGEGKKTGGKKSDDAKSGGKQSGGKQSGGDKSGGKKSGGKSGGKKRGGDKSRGDKSEGDKSGGKKGKSDKQAGKQSSDKDDFRAGDSTQKQDSSKTDRQSDDSKQNRSSKTRINSNPSEQQSKFRPPDWSMPSMGWLANLLRAVFYLAIIVAVVYLLWRYRSEALAAWRRFLEKLRELWEKLFGGGDSGDQESPELEAHKPMVRPFSDYSDPFLTGFADHLTPKELVRYSFEAFEAWAREHGLSRESEQTPYEFCREVVGQEKWVSEEVKYLAELYSQTAYSGVDPDPVRVEKLRQLWQSMQNGASPHSAAPSVPK